ncbi:MAG: glycerate kinase [Dehalococcoidia bacterium]
MTHPAPHRILVAPQEFKGSLTAFEAAAAIARGVREALPGADVVELPIADGGPGTVAIVAAITGARLMRHAATGPLGDPVDAAYALLERPSGRLAVIEAAAAAGMVLLPEPERDALRTSSNGVGEQVRSALDAGAEEIVVGVGGTATNDGGSGAAHALGMRLLDPAGQPLPGGGIHLARLARVEPPDDPRLADVRLRIAVDVQNPLLGPHGATAIYGAQKGLTEWQAPALEHAVARWAQRLRDDLGRDVAGIAGSGAGGGIPAGLLATFPRARIESGAALVAEAIGLRAAVAAADLVITGEGALDAQTAYGKSVGHVAALAHELGRPCLAVAGVVVGRPEAIADVEVLDGTPERAMAEAASLASAAAARLAGRWAAGR